VRITGGVRSLVTSFTDKALGSWRPVRGRFMEVRGLCVIMSFVCKKVKRLLRAEILLAILRGDR
jgi:hypothetical protein